MDTTVNHIKQLLGKYIDGSSVLKFAADHKLALLASSSVVLYGVWFFKRPRNLPPGPYGYPVVGSMSVMASNLTSNLNTLATKYGDVFCLWLGRNYYLVVLNSYDAIKEAYVTRGGDFLDRSHGKSVQAIGIEDFLFNAPYDDRYKLSRKIASQAIRSVISTRLDSMFDKEMAKVDDYIDQQPDKTAINLRVPVSRVFTNVICGILFGKNYAHGDPALDQLVTEVEEWFAVFMDLLIIDLTPSFIELVLQNSIKKAKIKTDKLVERFKTYISEHRKTSSNKDESVDVTDAFLKAEEKYLFPPDKIAGTFLSLLPDAVVTVVDIGLWVFVYLLNYPDYQERILQEILEVKKGTNDVSMSIIDRSKMPVTEAFIIEVFRCVTPSAIGVVNVPAKDTTFRGYNIPRDAHIVAHLGGAHSDPKYFPQPELFNPERFIKDNKICNTEAFIPFGTGRRMCLGEQIVRNEVFLFLTSMIQRYKITPGSEGIPSVQPDPDAILKKANKFTVKLKRRT